MNTSRIARLCALVISAITVMMASVLVAAPAHSYDTRTALPGHVRFDLLCQDGRITISPFMAVQTGYTGGQYMVYRYYVTNGSTIAGYSGWSGTKLMPWSTYYLGRTTYYDTTLHTNAVYLAPRGHHWGVQIQVGYWNPATRSYSYSGWHHQPSTVTTLTARYSDQSAMTRCYT